MVNVSWLRAVLKHNAMQSEWSQPLAVVYWPYITNPRCLIAIINVIRAVKMHVLSCPWYTVWYTPAVSQSAVRARNTQFIMKHIWSDKIKLFCSKIVRDAVWRVWLDSCWYTVTLKAMILKGTSFSTYEDILKSDTVHIPANWTCQRE